jgi:5'-3' exonuclease
MLKKTVTFKAISPGNQAIDRLPKKFLYFFLKVQLKISLNPKFQNFRVTR